MFSAQDIHRVALTLVALSFASLIAGTSQTTAFNGGRGNTGKAMTGQQLLHDPGLFIFKDWEERLKKLTDCVNHHIYPPDQLNR